MELHLSPKQSLRISPQNMLSMKILQMNSAQLSAYVEEILVENPLLELPDTTGFSEAAQYSPLKSKDAWAPQLAVPCETESLYHHLCTQLEDLPLPSKLRNLSLFVVASLNGKGWLDEEIAQLAAIAKVSVQDMEDAVTQVQSLEPVGVGARDLRQCLQLQLMQNHPMDTVALQIVAQHLEDLAKGHLLAISKSCGVSLSQVQASVAVIRRLNPRPSNGFSLAEPCQFITPDVVVFREDNQWRIQLEHGSLPQLRLSSFYTQLSASDTDKETRDFLQTRMEQATALIQSIAQRQENLLRCTQLLLEHQRDFFAEGVGHLQPLDLATMADLLGVHLSTVSRIASSKYLQCPFGIYPFSYFFSGGDEVNFGPGIGCPIISDQEGTKRNATLADYIKVLKLHEVNPAFKTNGGLMLQCDDLPVDYATILTTYVGMYHSEKVTFSGCGNYAQVEALVAMSAAYHGGYEAIAKKPYLLTILNMNTPLQLDYNMTETLITFAKYKQPLGIASAAMAGSTSPVTLAGTIALTNCEVLAGIALAQMVNPGTPVIYGSQTTSSDMATGSIAIGAPEGALCYKYGALMAKFYDLPCRGGGSLTDTKVVDAQAGFESMHTLKACYDNKMNLIMQSSGILDSYTSFSFEKLISDFEAINYVLRFDRDIEVNEETIPMDVIHKVGQGGLYLTEMHTFMNCRKEPLIPLAAVRGAVLENHATKYIDNIHNRMEKMLAEYKSPEIDKAKMADARKVLEDLGIDGQLLDKLENLA